jgi:hypothetical protein
VPRCSWNLDAAVPHASEGRPGASPPMGTHAASPLRPLVQVLDVLHPGRANVSKVRRAEAACWPMEAGSSAGTRCRPVGRRARQHCAAAVYLQG